MLTTAILTANPWKLQELYGSDAGVIDHYLRGGTSNTVDFDNEYMTFASNGTGTYTANTGIQSPFTWSFTDATNQTMLWQVNFGYGDLHITWTNIKYDDGQLRYTELYVLSGNNVLGEGIRIPK